MSFEVQPYDVYNSGTIPHPSHGVVFINGDINILPSAGGHI
jgi:hypothetical protein